VKLFREHHIHRAHQFIGENKKLVSSLLTFGILSSIGAVAFAMLSTMGADFFGGEKNAGAIIATFRMTVILLIIPLFGYLVEERGAHIVLKIGILCEMLGSALFFVVQNKWTFLIFAAGFFLRWTLFNINPLILNNSQKESGGFWFGLKNEMYSLGNFIGLMLLPYFLLKENWPAVALYSVVSSILGLLIIKDVTDKPASHKTETLLQRINIFAVFQKGIRYVKANHSYPVFALGTQLFQGVYFGAIWFLFPLHLAHLMGSGGISLGVYEIVTLCLAIVCGILADRMNWRKIEEISWGIMILLVWILTFYYTYMSLILLGIFIGIANNFFSAASYHALTRYNENPAENGGYSSFLRAILNVGYMVSPLLCGFLYEYSGFHSAMVYVAMSVSIIGMWMIGFCFIVKKHEGVLIAEKVRSEL
jgi:MFS family permease